METQKQCKMKVTASTPQDDDTNNGNKDAAMESNA